jgi:hypothetical protein
MATRSIIAVPHKGGWRGRYCHWDGYPDAKVPDLLLLVRRDGLEQARKNLMKNAWSSIYASKTKLAEMWHGNADDFSLVDGYGIAYKEDKPHLFTDKSKNFGWAQFLYLLADDKLCVYEAQVVGDKTTWKLVKKHKYLRETVSL